MKGMLFLIAVICIFIADARAGESAYGQPITYMSSEDSLYQDAVLEPCSYTENFESRDLGAWASYPLWQDNAYDQNFQVGTMVPGDSNLSIVAKVTPYSHVDDYVGAEKLLDMYLVAGSRLRFRYYLKTNRDVRYLKVRFAAGKYGKVDFTIPAPKTNKWVWRTVEFKDFYRENPGIAGKKRLKIYALAFLAEIPGADPAMPVYLGVDDISFNGARMTAFKFAEPAMYKLPAFEPYIPQNHYYTGDTFKLSGRWPVGADKVSIEITRYTDRDSSIYNGQLNKRGDQWALKPLKLSFPEGLYLGKLVAYKNSAPLSETEFTIHIAPRNMAGKHPRLLFDSEKKKWMEGRFKEKRFQTVYKNILQNAKEQREKVPLKSLLYDLDQFPDENWLPSWEAFGTHIYDTGPALQWNALAYAFNGDTVAGKYAKDILVKLAGWPTWISPWMIKRGRFSEHRMGTWSHRVALAYDLTYNLMTPEEGKEIRKAIMDKIVKGVHRTYVSDDNVISNTSNWIAHTVGGSLMNMAAMYGDGPGTENMEPYFTGAMMKFYAFLTHVTCPKGGAYGEGLGYNNYTFSNLSYSVPSLRNVFNIDVTAPLAGTYNEYIWGGLIKDRKWFGFGDSGDSIGAATNWAFLLAMRKAPRLSWYYHYLKGPETFDDVLFNTEDIPQDSPFDEKPTKVFPEIGTTVFKSGWEDKDFVFVMRTGPFYNHQHLDQGSFYLADKGVTFIEDQPIEKSSYYSDPLYQPSFIQPVAHSTILINHNPQSQRVGDPLHFAPGFDDHAFIREFLDGKDAAFSSGDIGRLYWGKVKSLTRNVLFIKPGTILMLDIAVPGEKDVDVTLLYHTAHLEDISAGQQISKITKDGFSLNIMHLAPQTVEAKAVETPHYLNTLLKEKPLVKEGMLTVTAHTKATPLVMANLFTVTTAGTAPEVRSKRGNGFVSGVASGREFAFSTKPGLLYKVGNMETNATAMTWDGTTDFVAMATVFRKNGALIVGSGAPVTFEFSGDTLRYDRSRAGEITVGMKRRPTAVILNGAAVKNFTYDKESRTVTLNVSKGKGMVVIQY
ncbi:MAG TPA: heparinase II/III family protein [Chitinophagaceae bacterium]|nr:heparinase II/III family protein [Chitinophagaceae bacterium]